MFLLYIFILILSFILKNSFIIAAFFFWFFLLIFAFFFLYYIYTIIFVFINKRKILNCFYIPEKIIDSKLKINFNFDPLILSLIKLYIITDQDYITINYKNRSFETIFINIGNHKVESFYIKFYDIFFIFYKKLRLKNNNFTNFISLNEKKGEFPQIIDEQLERFEKKEFSSYDLLRDYYFGDDPRRILWRAYFLNEELKVRDKWISETKNKICSIEIYDNFSKNLNYFDYKLKNYTLLKILYYISFLLKEGFIIKYKNKLFEKNNFISLQYEIFKDENLVENGDILFISNPYFFDSIDKNIIKKFNLKIFITTYDLFWFYEKGKNSKILEYLLFRTNYSKFYKYYIKKRYKEIEINFQKMFNNIY